MKLRALVGSGDKIGLFFAPFVIAGLLVALIAPSLLTLAQSDASRIVGIALLASGLVVWAWSVVLILTRVPRGKLITTGPYAVVKHPLYTGVSLLLLPGLGVLLGTWLGPIYGIALYAGSRIYAPDEEKSLSTTFGPAWDEYARHVWLPWL